MQSVRPHRTSLFLLTEFLFHRCISRGSPHGALWFAILSILLPLGVCESRAGVNSPDADLMAVSGPLSPQVSYGLRREKEALILSIKAQGFAPGGADVWIQGGVSADKAVLFNDKQAAVTRDPGDGNGVAYVFRLPAARLVDNAEGWKKLRLAFAVEWKDGAFGQPRLKQRFLHATPGAAHAGLSENAVDWMPVDLEEWEKQAEDRRAQIFFNFAQPIDGKATIVIEDGEGQRVRNLVSGQFKNQGPHRIVWDGLDENSNVMPPGKYRWRAISHPGLAPLHVMDFVNAPGSNHGTFHAASTNGSRVFLGTPVSEGGHQVVVLEKDGTFVRGFNAPHGIGLQRIQLAADARYIYAAYDGSTWGSKIDRTLPDWKAAMNVALVRYDIETGASVDFPGKKRLAPLLSYEVGPGSPGRAPRFPRCGVWLC